MLGYWSPTSKISFSALGFISQRYSCTTQSMREPRLFKMLKTLTSQAGKLKVQLFQEAELEIGGGGRRKNRGTVQGIVALLWLWHPPKSTATAPATGGQIPWTAQKDFFFFFSRLQLLEGLDSATFNFCATTRNEEEQRLPVGFLHWEKWGWEELGVWERWDWPRNRFGGRGFLRDFLGRFCHSPAQFTAGSVCAKGQFLTSMNSSSCKTCCLN